MEIANWVAFQVAYQWFGNIASPTGLYEVWLFKGLGRLFGADAVSKTQVVFVILAPIDN